MRIRVAQDKVELLQNLFCTSDNPQGVFTTYADILVFAASLGQKYQQRIPLGTIAKEPNPISIEVFNSRGYEPLLKLLALVETQNPETISANNIKSEEEIITILEEYANGGLSKLQEKLQGAIDYSERILLILSQEMQPDHHQNQEFDLSKFLP